MKRFIVFLLMVMACRAFGQITIGTHNHQDNGTTSQNSAVVQLSNVTAGNLITCEVSLDSSVTFNSVTDTANGTYLAACPVHTNAAITQQEGIYYFPNAAPGTYSITLNTNGAHQWSAISCQAWQGAANSNVLDTSVGSAGCLQQDQTGANPTAGNAVAPSQDGELVIASVVMGASITPVQGANYIMTDPDTITLLFPEYWVQSTAAATNGPYTASSANWTDQLAAFKAGTSFSACDLNQDGSVNILDVQLAANMVDSSPPCTAPSGWCTDNFYTAVVNAALPGGACFLPLLSAPPTVSFGNVIVGNPSTQTVTLSGAGTGSTTISQATVSGTGFSLSGPSLPLTLTVGQSANFSVTFAPLTAGNANGAITFVSNPPNGAINSPVTETLAGTGVNTHYVSLAWQASTSPNVVGYNVFRATSSSGPFTTPLNSSLVAGLSYTDSTVLAGQTYYYVATAVDSSNNQSADSSPPAQATVPSP